MMYQSGSNLRTSADLDNAILFRLNVSVWQDGQIVDYGGYLESFSDYSVKINGARYFRALCEFRVR